MITVNDACKHIKLPPLPVPHNELTTSVGAVNMTSASNTYNSAPPQSSAAPPALPVAVVLGMSTYPIASVYPPNESLILGGGNSDLSHNSNDSVSTHIPFLSPHLVWKCAVDSLNISISSCIHVSALIDHGSPAVLIENSLVSCLCLTH